MSAGFLNGLGLRTGQEDRFLVAKRRAKQALIRERITDICDCVEPHIQVLLPFSMLLSLRRLRPVLHARVGVPAEPRSLSQALPAVRDKMLLRRVVEPLVTAGEHFVWSTCPDVAQVSRPCLDWGASAACSSARRRRACGALPSKSCPVPCPALP